MRKNILFLLIGAMLLTLAGCSNDSGSDEAGKDVAIYVKGSMASEYDYCFMDGVYYPCMVVDKEHEYAPSKKGTDEKLNAMGIIINQYYEILENQPVYTLEKEGKIYYSLSEAFDEETYVLSDKLTCTRLVEYAYPYGSKEDLKAYPEDDLIMFELDGNLCFIEQGECADGVSYTMKKSNITSCESFEVDAEDVEKVIGKFLLGNEVYYAFEMYWE